ncbi:penicillin acylase family protein [Nocardioides rubriscoriae]|uniref:penicillin acylase family protein n=1 Tax=Nocardioides rubriscoriae TaxID=642762 RepID=UPI0011E02289|nr:penicillin acylase family protein [Nocardioides rubriscoriae]
MRRRRPIPFIAALAALAAGLTLVGPAPDLAAAAAGDGPRPGGARRAAAPPEVRNILPPGSHGNATALDVAALGGSTTATGDSPAHFADQLEIYDALTTKDPATLDAGDLDDLYKDAGFTPIDPESTSSPRPGLTIVRDRYGVPFIEGATFADVEYGAGYAAVEDRMFLMDVLRHTGQARLAEFVGDTPANLAMDQGQLRSAYYTEAEASAQVAKAARRAGAGGARLITAVDSFVEGINAAQQALCPVVVAPTCPVEYAALQKQVEPWTRADVVYVASLVGGIFGRGGGAEASNAAWLKALTAKFGRAEARRVYDDLRAKNDPSAPTTSSTPQPFQTGGLRPGLPGVALPDTGGATAPGTGAMLRGTAGRSRPAPTTLEQTPGGTIDLPDGTTIDLALERHGMSNALLVTGKQSTTGRPLAVFGPQTGYYAPQLLVEQVLDGPGIRARGVAFAGTNLFVQLGRGLDYAWSATSSGSDNVDTVVERLCVPGGGRATVRSTGYRVGSRCVPMKQSTHTETTTPNATSPTLPRTYEFLVLRTRHGIVQTRTTVGGRPVAIVAQRSTYGHEVDSVIGFSQFNDPGYVKDAATFQEAASHIDFSFNWFYADDRDISYYSSGLLPVRAPGVEPDLPRWGDATYDWRRYLRFDEHPRETNPARGYLVSWNNKQAPGFAAEDGNWSYGSVYRSLALEKRLRARIDGTGRIDLPGMVGVMSGAATADVRAAETLPWLLAVIGDDPRTARARGLLRTWLRHGAQRRDQDRNGAYADQAAIAIFDDWWEHGDRSVARTVLRNRLGRLVDVLPQKIDDHPRQGIGSSFNGIAWYGYVNKDLRTLLGQRVPGAYHEGYCGSGSLKRCRTSLRSSLLTTVNRVLREQGVTDPARLTYDKHEDDIRAVTGGLVGVRPIDWQNRPTFQQVVAFRTHRAR